MVFVSRWGHLAIVAIGFLTMVGLSIVHVVLHGGAFDAMGFGTGLGAIAGGSGAGAWAMSRGASVMAQIGSGQGIEGG